MPRGRHADRRAHAPPGRAGSPTRRKHKQFRSTVGPRAAKIDDKASQGFNKKVSIFNRLEVVAGLDLTET